MHNKCHFLLIISLILVIGAAQGQTRQKVLFNDNWKFFKGDLAGGEKTAFDDRGWKAVTLPHDWSIEGPFSEQWASATGYLPGGVGWYRKTFTLPSVWRQKNIYIYFDGVYKNSEVWINGHHLGKRPNGFIPFEYELTHYLNKTGKNTLAVKVDHTAFADSRWYTGSGIYRDVSLIALEPVHISLWGVHFSTPEVSKERASAKAVVTVENRGINSTLQGITIKGLLKDSQGKIAATSQKKFSIGKTGSAELTFEIDHPRLWSVDHPALYTLSISVYINGKETDTWSDQVGIRTIKFDPDKGFFLNGMNMKIKGVCVHDDAGALGVAVPEEVWERRLRTLKAGGCNSIRMSHNPHAEYLYRLCDKLGLLVMDEAFDEWEEGKNKWIKGWNAGTPGKNGYHEYFREWAHRDLKDMVLRNQNRPSVIMWSIGNEIDYPNDPYTHEILNTGKNPQIYGKGYLPDHPSVSRLGELSKELVAVVKKYDHSRPVTAALAGVVMSNTSTYPQNLDIVGYNYQEYRYAGDHQAYPNRVIYGSENGMAPEAWEAVDSNQYISAQYLWTGIDYLGEAGRWPWRSNGAGLLDLAGVPKSEYFFRKSIWTDTPMIYMGTTEVPKQDDRGIWSHKRADANWNFKEGERIRVNCFTNCEEAELFLNDQSLGRKKLSIAEKRVLYWDVNYAPGKLMVKGYKNNQPVAEYVLQSSQAPHALQLAADTSCLAGKTGAKVIQALITVVDARNIPVYDFSNSVVVNVEGGQLIGLENADHTCIDSYKTNTKKAFHGKLMAYIRVDKPATAVKIRCSSDGLTDATTTVNLQ